MSNQTNRRNFMKITAAAGAGFWAAGGVSPRPSRAAIDKVNFACIGIMGKGDSDSGDAKRLGNVVAICDIDQDRLDKWQDKYSKKGKTPEFHDYRKMLEQMDKSIDAVTVSTPDHSHAPASVMAMKMGKHCFTQKPMTHSIYEARLMAEIAAEKGLKTQMGNQGTANATLRKSAALIQAGAIGTVKEIHVWTNRPVWPQGEDAPTETPDVPSNVHWKEWVGPAKMRPYHPAYHPFKWRGWWDFGTGALGDMACHTLNMPFMALNLRDPSSVQAESSGHNKQTYPKWCLIDYVFPAIGDRPACTMRWYDGGKKPPAEILPSADQLGIKDPKAYSRKINTGSLVVGDKGSLFPPGDYGGDGATGILYNNEFVQQDKVDVEVEVTRSPGHFEEYVLAIMGKMDQARSNFPEYAGGLTETVLLGNLAVWAAAKPGVGDKIEWDAKNLKAKNGVPELAEIVKNNYHNGYKL